MGLSWDLPEMVMTVTVRELENIHGNVVDFPSYNMADPSTAIFTQPEG